MTRGKAPSMRVGDKFTTNEGYDVVVVEYTSSSEVYVEFDQPRICVLPFHASAIRLGRITNPYHPSVFGVGYLGVGQHPTTIEKVPTREYILWKSMLQRTYDEKYTKKRPTYRDVEVDARFHCFQAFGEWCRHQIGFDKEGFHLDKDLLVKGNKVYSPDTCVFVPKEINSLLIKSDGSRGAYPVGVYWHEKSGKYIANISVAGRNQHLGCYNTSREAFLVYKKAKEAYIKEVAQKYVDVIDKRVYNALMTYQVHIDD